MKLHRKTHPVVKVLSLLIPILLIALFSVVKDIAGFRVGSDTDFGAVYKLKYQGQTLYHWYIFNEDGTVRDDDFTTAEPYIWQDGNRVSLILQEHEGLDYKTLYFQNAEFLNYYLDNEEFDTVPQEVPEISRKLKLKSQKIEKITSGSEYVKLYRLTVPEVQEDLYLWAVNDAWDEEIWSDISKTKPEVISENDEIRLFYTERDENQESLRIFNPQESWCSHDYHTEENRTVFIEQAFEGFNFYQISYDNLSADTEHFVNQTACDKIRSIDDAYFRAKNEVKIPYSEATFRSDFVIGEDDVNFRFWEVTFSQMDNPDGETQTVYLDGDGKTVLILDGKPYTV